MAERSLAMELIIQERTRQVCVEGWSLKHDDGHTLGQLRDAAWCYYIGTDRYWPFSMDWYKPGDDRMRVLVKAGALCEAERARLQRLYFVPGIGGPMYEEYIAAKYKAVIADVDQLLHGIVESLAAHLRAQYEATTRALEKVGLGSAKVMESK